MSEAAQIFDQYEDLNGFLITPDGWERTYDFFTQQPPYQMVYECFTAEAEAEVLKQQGNNLVPPILRLSQFFIELSSLAKPDLEKQYIDIDPEATEFHTHVDVGSGHTFLANFDVTGTAHYMMYDEASDSAELYVDGNMDEDYYGVKFANSPKQLLIASRQLLIINGSSIEATLSDSQTTRTEVTSIPHAVKCEGDESNFKRTLLTVNAARS